MVPFEACSVTQPRNALSIANYPRGLVQRIM